MSNVGRKRRGNINSKYVGSSNLHVIKPHLRPLPISVEEKTVKKPVGNTDLLTEKNKASFKNSSLSQDSKMSAVKKDKPDPKEQKRVRSNTNQRPHYLSNFLALSESVLSSQQEKKKKDFKDKFLALQQVYKNVGKSKSSPSKIVPFTKETINRIPNASAPKKVDKPIIDKRPFETCKMTAHDVKKKPVQTKKIGPYHNLGDPSSMPQNLLSKKTVKKELLFTKPDSLQQSKKLIYHESPFSTHNKDKLKKRPGESSKKSEIQSMEDFSFWKNERDSQRSSSLSFDKETKLKKRPERSKAYSSHYLEEELMYYNHKYRKSEDEKKDYKWQERRKYSESNKYSSYNKDYAFRKKYDKIQRSSKNYFDFPQEERVFEELEDYEEVASIEDGSKDSKVPVRFRKCMVRYLPYTIYSYFRPKWYYLSRKRYVVNCLYASGRGQKIEESKLKLVNPLKLLEVAPNDVLVNDNKEETEDISAHSSDKVTEDASVHEIEEASQDASVENEEEIIEDVSIHENEETIEDEAVHENEDTFEDESVHENEETIEDALVLENEDALDNVPLNEGTSKDVSVKKIEETTEDVSVHGKEDDDLTKKSTPEKEKNVPVIDLRLSSPLKNHKANRNSSLNVINNKTPNKHTEPIIKNTDIEIIDLEEEISLPENSETNLIQADKIKYQNNKDVTDISTRVFLKCISNLQFSTDFYQGDAAIQSSLCEWKSHLIGLEYMLEVRDNTDETLIKKYHCGLCDRDLPVENTAGQIVINHIISYTHMCNYVAKHFPSSDYKFSKSARNYISEIVLQTCCEEINHRLGFHYMCIVKEHYFQNEYDKIKEHLNAMKHWDESSVDIYPTIINGQLESDIRENVACLLENMVDKILVDEPKQTFFTPQTIISSLRRSVVKDKKNDSSKISENTLGRCSQNTLIVLTPSPEVKPVNKSSLPSAEIKSPKKLGTSLVTPKSSKERSRIFNLLEVPVQDTKSSTDTQSSMTTSVRAFDNELISATDITSLQQSDSPVQEEVNPSENSSIDPSLNVLDTESTFKFNTKKPFNFRKYRSQDSAPSGHAQREMESVRIVRIRTTHNRPIPLESDTDEEDQVESVAGSIQLKEGATIVKNDLPNEGSYNTGAADNLLGEDISDGDFPELEVVEIVSPGGAETSRSRSRNKQHYKKSGHSKYCHKRGIWIKGSSSDKESSLRDPSAGTIPILGRKKYSSDFIKKSDEFSQDSYASSSSKRKKRHRSSSSPSLEEFLRKLSPSPVRKRSKSPLRPYSAYRKHGSMIRRHSRSPYKRYSRSPNNRRSRSPYRKRSRSPVRRRSRSPIQKRSRSPIRKRSRSPIRKHSRSPVRKRSRSPVWKRSRSPIKKRSRSPIKKHSRSPIRKHSRSPIRKRSQSPYRKHSRSPYRRHSRSPQRRHSKSPLRRRSRSPLWSASRGQSKHISRSPFRKMRGYKISKSPEKGFAKLPFHKYLKSPTRRSKSPTKRSKSPLITYTHLKSPIRSDSRISEDSLKYRSDPLYKLSKDSTKSSGSFKSISNLSVPHRHSEKELRKELNDLEEVSDEDESKYFNTPQTPRYMEIIKNLPESARIMLVKVLQRFSITNINPNDPSFYELMKFVASHSSEIQRLMSQPSALPEMSTPVQSNPTVQSQESFLHQYILSGLKGNPSFQSDAIPSNIFPGSSSMHFQQPPGPSTSGLPHHAQRSSLLQSQFAQPVIQQSSSQPLYPVQSISITPPKDRHQQMFMNTSITQQPPHFQPDAYRAVSPQKQGISPHPKVASEVMFKDLKATVSKIFGGDDALEKFGIKIPGFGGKPANESYSSKPLSIPQINPELQTSFYGNQSGLGVQGEAPTRLNDNLLKSYPNNDETYFSEAPRQSLHAPPPDAKVSFCDVQRTSLQRNLFPVVNNPETMSTYRQEKTQISVNDAKKSLAQRLASVLVKVGMTDVPAHLLQEMLMKIGAFSLNPPQDISEGEILGILRKLKYL